MLNTIVPMKFGWICTSLPITQHYMSYFILIYIKINSIATNFAYVKIYLLRFSYFRYNYI